MQVKESNSGRVNAHQVRRVRPNHRARKFEVTALERRLLLANYSVTSIFDVGDGTLRQAIINANNNPGLDNIFFNIASGAQSLTPNSEYPELTSPVNIDGTTQPGFEGRPIIEINGTSAGGGSNGFRLRDGSGGSTIRGLVINRFGSDAIDISQGNNNVIAGNFIGTNLAGTEDLGNQGSGVDVGTDGNQIGGITPADRNLISGNSGAGVALAEGPDDSVNNNRVQGNYIGTDITGTLPIPNNGSGVAIERGFTSTIGGIAAGAGNVIAFNGGDGVSVFIGNNNRILRNSIFNNNGLGIDLAPDGVTPNDAGDPDDGPNFRQNFPIVTQATAAGPLDSTVTGEINSNPNSNLRIEFFANTVADPSGNGEGRRFIGFTNVTTNANGNAAFSAVVASVEVGSFVTATATSNGGEGSTSEFSAARAVTIAGDVIAPTVIAKAFLFETLPLKVTFKFSEAINPSQLGTEDVVVLRIGNPNPISPTGFTYNPATQTATFTLPGILDDGVYTARLRADAVRDLAGNQMAADSVLEFFVLAGDANRDRTVNFNDLLVVAQHYGQDGQTFSQGNFDYSENGLVNFGDLLIVAQNYNATVLQAPTSAGQSRRDRHIDLVDELS